MNTLSAYQWDQTFVELFERCCGRCRSGDLDFTRYYNAADLAFLDDLGYKPREFFDFVEDHVDGAGQDPTAETALLVASVRRDFWHHMMGKEPSAKILRPSDLPGRDEELGGHAWLPRILAKARAKLRGELDPEVMYGCGGDRMFLRRHDLHPADFLRIVWAAGDDDSKILDYVNASTGAATA